MKIQNAIHLAIAASTIAGLTLPSAVASAQYVVDEETVGLTSIVADPNTVVLFEETGSNIDDDDVLIALPFVFTYFGRKSSELRVHTNGFVMWGPGTSAAYWRNADLADAAEPNGIIAPLWDDLILRANTGARVSWVVQGSEPDRVAVVEWADVRRVGSHTEQVTFQLAIFETTDDIEFRYAPNPAYTGGTATIGIENQAGDVAVAGVPGSPSIAELPLVNVRLRPRDIVLTSVELSSRVAEPNRRLLPRVRYTARNIDAETSVSACVSVHADPALATPAVATGTGNITLTATRTQTGDQTVVLWIPQGAAVGHYYLGATLDCAAAVVESNESNNQLAESKHVGIGSAPTLTIDSISTPVSMVEGGQTLPIQYEVSWGGPLSGGPFTFDVYASPSRNRLNTSVDPLIYAGSLDLPQGASEMGTVTATIPRSISGPRYLWLRLDQGRITLVGRIPPGVFADPVLVTVADTDLVAERITPERRGWPVGSTTTVELTVSNPGSVASTPFEIHTALADNPGLTGPTTLLDTHAHPGLAPQARETLTISFSVPEQLGPHYVGMIVDQGGTLAETDESNNRASAAVEIYNSASGVDVVVERVDANQRIAVVGEAMSFEFALSNRGDAMSGPFSSAIYISTDDTITSADPLVYRVQTQGIAALTELPPQQVVGTIPASMSPGDYYVAMVADDALALGEADTSNNTRLDPILITVRPRPETDVNGDGVVNVVDVQYVANAISGAGPTMGADVNVDMVIDARDLADVVNAALVD